MAKKKKKNWIAGAIENPGALTRKAKVAGMSVSAYMANPPRNISTTTKRQISLARTLKGFSRKGK
jgi:hypothetical protein